MHNIDPQTDTIQSIIPTWHGLEDREEVIDLSRNGNAKLRQRDVVPVSVTLGNEPLDGSEAPEGWQAGQSEEYRILRSIDLPNHTPGVPYVEGKYEPLTNNAFLDLVVESMRDIGHTVTTVGSVRDRRRIFTSVQLDAAKSKEIAGREYKLYLNFGSSHDMSSPFWVNLGSVCTVCDNTFSYNLLDESNDLFRYWIKHTKNSPDKLSNVPAMVQAAMRGHEYFAERMEELANIDCDEETAKALLYGQLVKGVKPPATKTINRVERILSLYKSGAGNDGNGLDDLFQGITDFYSHESATSDDGPEGRAKQYVASEFGSARQSKMDFFTMLTDDKARKKTLAHGRKVIREQARAIKEAEAVTASN
jgi:hypothetical protein